MSLPFLSQLKNLPSKLAEKTKHFITSDESTFSQFFGIGEKSSTLLDTSKEVGKTILRAPGRAAGSVVLSALGQKKLTPTTGPEKFLYGEEPIKSLGVRSKEAEKSLEEFGLSKGKSQAFAPLIIFGATALDLYPGTAGKGKAGVAALKELSEDVVDPLVRKYGKTVAGQIVEFGGKDLASRALVNGNEDEIVKVLGTDNVKLLTKKVIDFLEDVVPIRKETEALQSFERSKRAGAVGGILAKGEGKQAFISAKSSLKGELPKAEISQFMPTQKEVDTLFDVVRKTDLQPYQKITAGDGLGKLLGDSFFEGKVPTNNEIKLLRDIFGTDFAKAVSNLKPRSTGISEAIAEVANVPRALMASMDMSAPFRQGLLLGVERPKEATKAFGQMFRYFKDEKYFNAAMTEIETSPMAFLREGAKLDLTDVTGHALTLSSKEEGFMTNMATKIPGIGKLVKASERAFAGFLNKLRADSFDNIAKEYIAGGETWQSNPKLFTGLADFINTATGRAKLPGQFADAAPLLNSVFFSPRLIASRVQMFNPQYYFSLPSPVRKLAVKSFLKMVGTGKAILSLASLYPGSEVETDPRSSDFGKIKIGNARWDVWGGFQQWFVLGARLATGQSKAAASGTIREIDPTKFPFDSRLDTVLRFGIQKLAPIPALVADLLRGQTAVGEELGIGQQAISKLVPLYIQDIYEAVKEEENIGLGIGIGVPAFFGIGSQIFDSTDESKGKLGLPKLPQLPKLPKLPKIKR